MEKVTFEGKIISSYFYHITLLDLLAGIPLEQINDCLMHYQEEEFYEACKGIKQAIEDSSELYIHELESLINQFEIENKDYLDNEFSELNTLHNQ